MYYIKIALITLVVSIALAEFVGPRFGLNSFVLPEIQTLISQKIELQKSNNDNVATLKLTSEKDKKFTSPTVTAIPPDKAFDVCYKLIKAVSLFPEFTRVPRVNPADSRNQYQYKWNTRNPVRTLSTKGADIALTAKCYITKENGSVSLFQINNQELVVNLSGVDVLGGWNVVRSVSEIDNSTNVSVSSVANTSIIVGKIKIRPELIIQCREDTTRLHLSIGQEVGDGSIEVVIGIDGTNTFTSQWNYTRDKKNLYPQEHHIGLLQLMMKGTVLSLGFKSDSEQQIDLAYDLSHLRAAIYPLQTACHWK